MSLYTNALKHGTQRIFTLLRLSLPLISTLGLTLAAVLTVIAVANTLLFQPLPDIDENDLYQIELQMDISEGLTAPFFSDPRRVASAKQAFGPELSWGQISPGGSTIEVNGSEIPVVRFDAVSGSPEVLGLNLLLGQSSEIDNVEEGIWISSSLWQSTFGSVGDLSSQTLRLEGRDMPIFGVFDDFTSIEIANVEEQTAAQIWRFSQFDALLEAPDTVSLNIGTLSFVRGNRNAIPQSPQLKQWFLDYVDTDITIERAKQFLLSKEVRGEITPYREAFIGDSQTLVFLLLVAMVSLLVMACLNLLNMFIAHYQSRNKEFSIQLCMGSSVAKLRGLNFAENVPMFLMAIALGLIAASWLIKILPVLAGDNLPMLEQIGLDLTSVIVALLVIALINFVFAFISVIHVDKNTLTDSLNSSGKGTPAQQNQSINKVLMIVQLTLACVLLTTAIASVKNSYQDTYTDLGYSMPNAYEVSMQISDAEWQESLEGFEQYRGSELQQLRREYIGRLSALGGEVVDIHGLPLTGEVIMNAYPDPDTGDTIMMRPLLWGPEMLSAFDIQLLAGRDLSSDDIDAQNILISKSFAAQRRKRQLGANCWY
jgi:ABC-type antimicrobial peptide transport system permease subunit